MSETTAVEEQLVFCDHRVVKLHNGSRQWIDIKRFTFPGGAGDRGLLELLIRHVRYRHCYATPVFYDAELIHGPYWLEAIRGEAFSPVSAGDAEALITTWANYAEPIPASDRTVFDGQVFQPVRDASSIYQLADLRSVAQHDWGGVVGVTGFYEFVLIDRRTNELTLMVASDD
jgi:hypothetical protein